MGRPLVWISPLPTKTMVFFWFPDIQTYWSLRMAAGVGIGNEVRQRYMELIIYMAAWFI